MSIMSEQFTVNRNGGYSIFVYIDNSNLFIETMKFGAKKHGFRWEITQDCRMRIRVKKFLNLISSNQPRFKVVVYGSASKEMDKLWAAFRESGVYVVLRNRSSWTKKEKRVDCAITADAVEDIYEAGMREINGKLVFVSGDGDLIEPIEKALLRGWSVDVWALDSGLSNELTALQRENPTTMTVSTLDEKFDDFTFITDAWTSKIPPERSLFLLLDTNELVDDPQLKHAFLSDVVKASVRIFKMPMGAKFLKPFVCGAPKHVKVKAKHRGFTTVEAKGTRHQQSHTALVLVCSIGATPSAKELEQVFCSKCDAEVSGPPGSKRTPRYDFKKDVYQRRPELRKHLGSICFDIQTYEEYAKLYEYVDETIATETASVPDMTAAMTSANYTNAPATTYLPGPSQGAIGPEPLVNFDAQRKLDDSRPRPSNFRTELCIHRDNPYHERDRSRCNYAHNEAELLPRWRTE